MSVLLRLLKFMRPFSWLVALAILMGSLTVAFNMGLLSMAAYLISDAALMPLMIALTLPSYFVRLMGVMRPLARYGERLVSHNVTFRLLTQIRVWAYNRLEPLLPTQMRDWRSGDLLARLVSDVDELQNVYLQGISPVLVWVLIAALTYGFLTIFSGLLAWVAVGFLVLAGLAIPLLCGLLTRRLGKGQVEARAQLKAHLVDGYLRHARSIDLR